MPWARIDDSWHSHPKLARLSLAARGLLADCISYAAAHLTDGYVPDRWLRKQAGRSYRKLLNELTAEGMLVAVDAGSTVELAMPARRGLRTKLRSTSAGPCREAGYFVHDFLDFNRARVEVEEDRAAEAAKKRDQRSRAKQQQIPWHRASVGEPVDLEGLGVDVPEGVPPNGGLRDGSGNGVPPRTEDGPSDARACARSSSPVVQEALDILHQADRLHVDAVGIENAIAAHPNGDALKAARRCVAWGTDPAYWVTNAATLMWKAYAEQEQSPARNGRRNGRATAADFQALKTAEGGA